MTSFRVVKLAWRNKIGVKLLRKPGFLSALRGSKPLSATEKKLFEKNVFCPIFLLKLVF